MRDDKKDSALSWLVAVLAVLSILFFISQVARAKEARTLRMTEKQVAQVRLGLGRSTVLSFSSKPTKVILGRKGTFAVEYVENDIAIAPLSPNSRSNLFVYLPGRRFAFSLVAVGSNSDEIVLVRDVLESEVPVKLK